MGKIIAFDSPAFRHALWAWLPGVFAGALPWVAFLLTSGLFPPLSQDLVVRSSEHFRDGQTSHLLVMAMVTASFSVTTSFLQALTGEIPGFLRDGRGPVALTMCLLGTVVVATVMYALQETGLTRGSMHLGAWLAMFAALGLSFFMEIAMARLHVLGDIRTRHPATSPAAAAS